MRQIAPGRTVAMGFSLQGDPPSDIPFLPAALPRNGVLRKLYLLQGRARYGFAGAPVGRQRRVITTFLRDHGVTIVLAEFGPTGAALREICQTEGIPLVVNFHGYDATVMPKLPQIQAAYRLLARDAAGFLCGSHHFSDTLRQIGFPKNSIQVIPCGVRTEKFNASSTRTGRRLIAVGRLTPKKAPLLTLEAFALARTKIPDMTLDMIGDGPLKTECEAFVANHDLRDSVTLHGAVDHNTVRATLADADIFVQHSITASNGDTESQGIYLVEAMASALPVVTTDHNGFSETVLAGETGFLVPERDVPTMAKHIVELAQDADLRKSLGAAGRARAESMFDERIITARLREYLSKFADF